MPFQAVWPRSRSPLSFSDTVLSRSTMFSILSSLIRVNIIFHSQQSDDGLTWLPFSAVWSGFALVGILSLIRVYTDCYSQQCDQGLHCMPFSVWSGSTLFDILSSLFRVYTICHSFIAVLSRCTLLAILSSPIKVYTVCHSEQSDQQISNLFHSQPSFQGLNYLPF